MEAVEGARCHVLKQDYLPASCSVQYPHQTHHIVYLRQGGAWEALQVGVQERCGKWEALQVGVV